MKLRNIINYIKLEYHIFIDNTRSFYFQYIAFGVFGSLNYPIYWILWKYYSEETYENIYLRSVATVLCIPLIFSHYWKGKLKLFIPIYFFITVTFCLPFFFTFMMMSNHASSVWLMSTTAVMFWMILLFDFFGFVLSSFLGCTAAVLLFMALNDGFHWDSKYDGYVYQYIGNFLVGLLFAKNKDKYEKMKLNGARELGGHVAHELRTPLTTIEIGSRSLKDYLPKLFSIYEKAKLAGLDVEGIESRHYKIIKTLLNGIETSSLYSNLTIDAILKNMYRSNNKEEFKKHSILECYKAAYERYPFKGNEKSFFGKIEIIDFSFNGSDILMSHIFFNLIKNAIYFIHSEKRGNISAWTKIEKNKNTLFFQDTSRGIKKDEMCHIFEKFYSTTKIGTGLGLAFCRKTMISFGGDIKCYSEYGKFTRFELIFKKEKDDK